MPIPALFIPLIFWTGIAAFSSWAVSKIVPFSSRDSEEIQAPIGKVWDQLMDVSSYPRWNEHLVTADGPENPQPGDKFEITSRLLKTKAKTIHLSAVVTDVEKPRLFGLRTKFLAKSVLTVVRRIELEALDEHRTRVTQSIGFTGVLSPGVPFISSESESLEASNQKLKALIEGGQ